MSTQSCIYEGYVSHTRLRPVRHSFKYNIFMMYVDLDELTELFKGRWLWSVDAPAPARFRRSDYPGPVDQPLDESIRDLVEQDGGHRPQGPIRLLTHFRYFGFGFNPVSFFFCFSADASSIEAIVSHVTSTPWGETHSYVIRPKADRAKNIVRSSLVKKMHVSPFMPMDLIHEFRFSLPSSDLTVHMTDTQNGVPLFHADLRLERKEISTLSLFAALAKHPFMTARIVAGIYYQALKLYLKKTPFYPHPGLSSDRQEVPSR